MGRHFIMQQKKVLEPVSPNNTKNTATVLKKGVIFGPTLFSCNKQIVSFSWFNKLSVCHSINRHYDSGFYLDKSDSVDTFLFFE